MTPGVHIFCDGDDVANVSRTVARLRRAGASRALLMVEHRIAGKPGTRWMGEDTIARAVEACREDANVGVTLVGFPCPLKGDIAASRDRLEALCRRFDATPMTDAEPRTLATLEAHWSEPLVRTVMQVPGMQITTTRHEVLRLGPLSCVVYAQAEQQTSMATQRQLFSRFGKAVPRESTVLVTGAFDQPGDPRTLAEFSADLAAAEQHAKLVRAHAVWSAHTLGDAECDRLREWGRGL